MTTVSRFLKDPGTSFFLFGPRGTGKSTWLRQQFPDALWLDLLDRETYRIYAAKPERLSEVVMANPEKQNIVLDEVQKIPELLDTVHYLMEKLPDRRFILTGSSARKLKRSGVDLLAGRAANLSMHPFMAAELRAEFSLDDALQLGLIPVVYSSKNKVKSLNAYAGLYIEQEVKAESLVRDVGSFARFLEAISFSHASVLNVSSVARECQVNRNTVQGYLEVLEDLLLGFQIPVFSKHAKRHLVQHTKFYFFDVGVFRSIRPSGPLDRPEELAGAALEGLIAQHLQAWIAYNHEESTLFFWRTKSGNEVDFVVYGPRAFLAIEIKNSRNVHRCDVRPLRTFKQDYEQAQTCLVYRGKERMLVDGVMCIPCEEFLAGIHPANELTLSAILQ
ncbi:MAG: ATP-binding protein [Spartobacteria bacterium]|nr:ATP-binding protein [Spartobacteria bacterium]